MKNDILEIQLEAAIHDTEVLALQSLSREVITAYLKDYAEDFEALKASINYLPVPLDIMHTPNVCTYFALYRQFEELHRLYDVADTCKEALAELHENHQKTEQKRDLKQWLAKYKEVSVEACFLPEKDPNSNYLTFNEAGIKIMVPYDDYKAIFEMTDVYFPLAEKLKIPSEFISDINWEN